MWRQLALFVSLCFAYCAQVSADSDPQCVPGATFISPYGVLPELHLTKYEGAALLLVGFGGFSIIMALLYVVIRRHVYHDSHSLDTAFDAGGNVSTSMTAVTFATQLLWPGDLLLSSILCVTYGMSGPYLTFAAGILNMALFPLLSTKFKTRAPGAKTFTQIIKARFGTSTHIVFILFAFLVNLVIMATVFLSAIAIIQSTVSDASPEFCVVIFAVICGGYSLLGGLGSVFYVNYFNLAATFISATIFVVKVVFWDDKPFGTIEEIYDRVNCLTGIDGNRDGSRFTFLSEESWIYAVQILFLTTSITYCDQASWQNRIAAKPLQGVLGILGGTILWLAIPANIGLLAGITYLSQASADPSSALNIEQVEAGVVTSYMLEEAFGKGGAIMMLTMMTMLIMSTGSAEIIGMTSVIVYDIYQIYIRPFRRYLPFGHCICCGKLKPGRGMVETDTSCCDCPHVTQCRHCKEDEERLRNAGKAVGGVVHYTCPHHRDLRSYQDSVLHFKGWGVLWVTVLMIPYALVLHETDIDITWLIFTGAVLTVPAFPCVILATLWSKTTGVAMVIASVSGLVLGVGANVVTAVYKYDWEGGYIQASKQPYAVLAGSATGFFVSLFVTTLISLATHKIKTQEDAEDVWRKLRDIDNPMYPWAAQIAGDFPHLSDGAYRPTEKQLEEATKSGRYAAYIGSSLFIVFFLFVVPGVLASLEVLSANEFKVYIYVNAIFLFVCTFVVVFVTPFQEIKSILGQMSKNKNKKGELVNTVSLSAYQEGDTTPSESANGKDNKAFQTDNAL